MGLRIGAVGRRFAYEGGPQAAHMVGRKIAQNEDDARAPVPVGPALQPRRRMEDVLHAVDHHGTLGIVVKRDDALHAQHVRPVHLAQHVEKHVEARGGQALVARQAEGADARVVPVGIMRVRVIMGMMIMRVMRVGMMIVGVMIVAVILRVMRLVEAFRIEPAGDVRDLAFKAEQACVEQVFRPRRVGLQNAR